jgi:MFS family permease
MQTVGFAWLMVSFGAGPLYVALTQTASSLPFFMFALPAGAIGDVVDRRKLILFTEAWMVGIAVLLAALTIAGAMTPWLLLAFTFAISTGDALEAPAWRAILPELVPRSDLAAASALSGIEFNLARAIGPALAGALIAAAGVGAAFVVIGVVRRRHLVRRAVEALAYERRSRKPYQAPGRGAALRPSLAGIRGYDAIRDCDVLRSAILALLPAVAESEGKGSAVYGCCRRFGVGAIAGALLSQRAPAGRWMRSSRPIAMLGVTIALTGMARGLGTRC